MSSEARNEEAVVLNVLIEAVPGHEEELAGLLRELVAPTRREPGCLIYELHRDPTNAAKFMFFEKFSNQAALDEHVTSPYFKAFLRFRESANPDPVASAVVTNWRSVV